MNAHLTTTETEQPGAVEVLPPVSPATATLIERAKTFYSGIRTHLQSAAGYTLLFGQTILTLKATCEKGQFEKLRKEQLPEIPESTAQYYATLTTGIKGRCLTVRRLLEEPQLIASGEFAAADIEKINKVVHDQFDGKTITAIARECKAIRQAKKPGDVAHVKPKKLSLAERHAEAVKLAQVDWKALEQQGMGYAERFTLLEDIEVQAQIATLEILLTARKQWVDAAKKNRDAKAIKELFAAVGIAKAKAAKTTNKEGK